MDLRNLNTFIQVAELGSFTRAAQKLGYAQPTISFQIRQLEKELDMRLFDRIGHTVRLTQEGHGALAYAQQICSMAQAMMAGDSVDSQLRGELRIAMADSLSAPLLSGAFAQFRRRYPFISVHVTTAGTDEMFRLLDHNEVDMVCTLDHHFYNTSYVIANEEKIDVHFVAAADHLLAKKHDLQVHDLLRQPFLLTEKGMSYRRMLDEDLARDNLEINPIMEVGRADLICDMVADGMGLSFLPDYVTQDAVQQGRVVRLDVSGVRVELWKQLLYHRDKWVSLQMEAMIEEMSKVLLDRSEK
ncbi:MAG: LysR family transcriptional regulator [Clostridia bacterium]|nr:LysR family transcriptional regulator [Clostridia bacterium]